MMLRRSRNIHLHGAGDAVAGSSLILVVCLCLFCCAQPAHAAISTTGDVQPAYPATWTSSTTGYIGKTSAGTMDITDGSTVSSGYGYLGYESGSTGGVTVNGDGSTWTNSGYIYVGRFGSGTLNITNGGAVSNDDGYIGVFSGSTSEVTVNGYASIWTNSEFLFVGYSGSGTLNISGGGAASSNRSYIGFGSGSTGEVTVDGDGSIWTNTNDLAVGNSDSGTLNITGGGTVSNYNNGIIGRLFGSTGEVTVDGTGSTLANGGNLTVGGSDSGKLNITNGGAVSSNGATIGRYSGSTGEVTVNGIGSTWTNIGDLRIGDRGGGTLNITDDGLVSVAGNLTIDYNSDGDGFINMANGGMLALYGDADESLTDFLGLVNGTDAIRYWDDSVSDWADITGATYGRDYTLSYLTEGDLSGYTMLTVPEPTTLSLFALGTVAMLRRRRLA